MDCEAVRDVMLDVLYGEADEAAARLVSTHQAACAACRDEMAGLRRVRRDLPAWTLPRSLRPPSRMQRLAPRLALAASLILAIAGGAYMLAGSELRYADGELTVRFGPPRVVATAAASTPVAPVLTAAPAPPAAADPELVTRIEAMLRDSERRQAETVDARLVALRERLETQRRYDLARVSAGLAYIDGKNGQDVARTTELMGYVLKASQQR